MAPSWIARAKAMRARGKSWREVAALVEVSDRTVRYWLDERSRAVMHAYSAGYYRDNRQEIIAAVVRNRKARRPR